MAESSVSDIAAVEEYLAKVPEPARSTLQTVRASLRALLPEATEGMSYGMPAFKLRKKPVAGYAAFVAHCGFYPMSGRVVAAAPRRRTLRRVSFIETLPACKRRSAMLASTKVLAKY